MASLHKDGSRVGISVIVLIGSARDNDLLHLTMTGATHYMYTYHTNYKGMRRKNAKP